jgi:hypothetical protein
VSDDELTLGDMQDRVRDRAAAYLTVLSPTEPPAALAEAVGLPPDGQWSKGEPRGRLKEPVPTNGVQFDSLLDEDRSPTDHISALVERLRPHADAIRALLDSDDVSATSHIVEHAGFATEWFANVEAYVSPTDLQALAYIGAAIAFDAYIYADDPIDEPYPVRVTFPSTGAGDRSRRLQNRGDELQVLDERFHLRVARLVVALAEDCARVDRRRHVLREVRLQPFAALFRDAELAAEQRLRRGRAEADEDARTDDGELRLEPLTAGRELAPARLGVDPPLAARLPLEVLHRVRHVDGSTVDAGLDERIVEDAAGRPDERRTVEILAVARLLADEHRRRTSRPRAEHRLRGVLPQGTGAAVRRLLPQPR